MGDSGSQALGFALAACGIAATLKVAQTTVATLLLPLLILAVPILDTTLVTFVRLFEGSPGLPRRPRPHVAPARLPRALGPPGGVPARDDLRRARRDEPDVHRHRRREDHRDRRPPDLRVVRPVRELPGRRRAQPNPGDKQRTVVPGLLAASIIHRRRVVEVVVDAILITVSLYAAYVLRLGSNGTPTQRRFLFATAADPAVLRATSSSFRWGSTAASGVTPTPATRARIAVAVLASEFIAFGVISALRARNDFPRASPRHRRLALHAADRCVALLGTCRVSRGHDAADFRAAPTRARRRRWAKRQKLRARAPRDAGRAARRLRRRRPAALAAAPARRAGARQRRRDAANRAGSAARHRLRRRSPTRPASASTSCAAPVTRRRSTASLSAARSIRSHGRRCGPAAVLTRIRPAASRLHAALAAALPLLTIFVGLCLLYGWQAWLNVTPWVVRDEFERAQLSTRRRRRRDTRRGGRFRTPFPRSTSI